MTIETRSKEAYFTAKIEDAHGQPVPVTVTDIPTPFGTPRTYGTFCGETKEPIAFDRGEGLRFSIGYWDPAHQLGELSPRVRNDWHGQRHAL